MKLFAAYTVSPSPIKFIKERLQPDFNSAVDIRLLKATVDFTTKTCCTYLLYVYSGGRKLCVHFKVEH